MSTPFLTKEAEDLAESVLCAMAFEHGRDLAQPWLLRMRNGIAPNPYLCQPGEPCVFCDAARSGK